MKITNVWMWNRVIGLISLLGIAGCGSETNSNESMPPPAVPAAMSEIVGDFNMSCSSEQSSQQAQQKVPFQQQKQSGCNNQQFVFIESNISTFEINLNCEGQRLDVKNFGPDHRQASLPIQNDGSIDGQLFYLQQVAYDGRGRNNCWVQYAVNFFGRAHCHSTGGYGENYDDHNHHGDDSSRNRNDRSTYATPPSDSIELTTAVNIQPTSVNTVQMSGVYNESALNTDSSSSIFPWGRGSREPSPSPSPRVSPSPSPSISRPASSGDQPGTIPTNFPTPRGTTPRPTPTATPTPVPSITPSPTPTTSPRPSHRPTPRPTVTYIPPIGTISEVTVCIVDNPCPTVGKTDYSCSAQQSGFGGY